MAILIVLNGVLLISLNKILALLLQLFSTPHYSKQAEQECYTQKLSVGIFLSTLGPVFSFSESRYPIEYGFLAVVFSFWLFLGFGTKLFEILDINILLSFIARYKIKNTDSPYLFTQSEANKAYEPLQYNLAQKNAELIAFIWFSLYYCFVFPFGICISIMALCWIFAVDKYLIVSRYGIPKYALTAQYSLFPIGLLKFSFIPLFAGSLTFQMILSDDQIVGIIYWAVGAGVFLIIIFIIKGITMFSEGNLQQTLMKYFHEGENEIFLEKVENNSINVENVYFNDNPIQSKRNSPVKNIKISKK
eukprot:TRINITY_DN7687_c0_g1_i1.p2 TRINITY_DN7687_c0_g1~~TRINITY_DN7687_c0_g1_i1.p2  ORF type:complete len:304 (-),score=22.18 TRINITY_DN7687_c0_g1_i1:67-978(-)